MTDKPGADAAPARSAAFAAAFRGRAPRLDVRPQRDGDDPFLERLFIACSPLAGLLPPPMLEQQARLQHAAHLAAHPAAMRWIVLRDGQPIGRIAIGWREHDSHCVDVAVLPAERGTRAGGAMLRAWLDMVDAEGLTATLSVARDNPAAAIYLHLGFAVASDDDLGSSHVRLCRSPRLS